MSTQEDNGWEEVYRANGCSPFYVDDAIDEPLPAVGDLALHEAPPEVVIELEPSGEDELLAKVPLPPP